MTTADSWPKLLLFRTHTACYAKSKYSLLEGTSGSGSGVKLELSDGDDFDDIDDFIPDEDDDEDDQDWEDRGAN